MARLIRADGTEEIVIPMRGKKFTLDELQKFVGGYIELTKTRHPVKTMYVNEEGVLNDLPINHKATALIDSGYQLIGGVRGDVLVCERGEG